MTSRPDDEFKLYDLRVEVVATDRPMVCSHRAGDAFEVHGENLVMPAGQPSRSTRWRRCCRCCRPSSAMTHPHDWMTTDADVACPDPHCGARFRDHAAGHAHVPPRRRHGRAPPR